MNKCKVSVIVPVYNAEAYLASCIETLMRQSLQECEFIFINDGSTDNSGAILEHYQAIDSRMIVINQDNQGVSIARNVGLKQAVGEFIGFVDADDYVDSDMYATMYRYASASECDAIISPIAGEMDGRQVVISYPFPMNEILDRSFIEQEILPYFIRADNCNTVCNKIYRNRLVREYCITFPDGVALGEDGLFNMRFMSKAHSVMYIGYTGYHYREAAGSATRNIVKTDYFARSLEVYQMDVPEEYGTVLNKEQLQKLKSIKFIHNILSYIHLYFTPASGTSFARRYSYVRTMIAHPKVHEALRVYTSDSECQPKGYIRLILRLMERKFTFGLYCATTYSRLRNK